MPRTILKSFIASFVVCASAAYAHAQATDDANQDRNHFSIGIGMIEQHAPFNSASPQTLPIPFLSVKQGIYYFEGAETGLHFDKETASLRPSLDVFIAARSPSGRDRQKLSVDAGARVSLETKLGTLSGELRHDVTDKFGGSEFVGRYSYPVSIGRLTITAAVQASWLDRKTANYMYGVTTAQRARMIKKERRVVLPVAPISVGALNPGGDISMALQLGKRLTLFAAVAATYLDKSIHRSAAIEQKWEAQSGLGIAYRF